MEEVKVDKVVLVALLGHEEQGPLMQELSRHRGTATGRGSMDWEERYYGDYAGIEEVHGKRSTAQAVSLMVLVMAGSGGQRVNEGVSSTDNRINGRVRW